MPSGASVISEKAFQEKRFKKPFEKKAFPPQETRTS
jgi:hypothetical protein